MERFDADNDEYRSKTVQSLLTLAGKVVIVTGNIRHTIHKEAVNLI